MSHLLGSLGPVRNEKNGNSWRVERFPPSFQDEICLARVLPLCTCVHRVVRSGWKNVWHVNPTHMKVRLFWLKIKKNILEDVETRWGLWCSFHQMDDSNWGGRKQFQAVLDQWIKFFYDQKNRKIMFNFPSHHGIWLKQTWTCDFCIFCVTSKSYFTRKKSSCWNHQARGSPAGRLHRRTDLWEVGWPSSRACRKHLWRATMRTSRRC